ncbi:hypothetical protein D3C81_1727120 [compost metagenome]
MIAWSASANLAAVRAFSSRAFSLETVVSDFSISWSSCGLLYLPQFHVPYPVLGLGVPVIERSATSAAAEPHPSIWKANSPCRARVK